MRSLFKCEYSYVLLQKCFIYGVLLQTLLQAFCGIWFMHCISFLKFKNKIYIPKHICSKVLDERLGTYSADLPQDYGEDQRRDPDPHKAPSQSQILHSSQQILLTAMHLCPHPHLHMALTLPASRPGDGGHSSFNSGVPRAPSPVNYT